MIDPGSVPRVMRESLHYHNACGCVSRPRAKSKIFQRCRNSGAEHTSSVTSRSSSRPSFDVQASCLILNESRSVSDRSASLVAAGTLAALNGEPDVAWSERTRRTAVLVASSRLGWLSLAAWYRWCGGQGEPVISKFSILRRTVTSVFRTSEKLLHCL